MFNFPQVSQKTNKFKKVHIKEINERQLKLFKNKSVFQRGGGNFRRQQKNISSF